MTHAQTFHARVADDAIGKVTRLFNARLDDIFAELVQNARRARASEVCIDLVEHGRLGPAIRVSDNGPGIADPRTLFTLGQSAWDSDTIRAEDAAGMGFFALAGRRIEVIVQEAGASRSWILEADPSAFKGEIPITAAPGPDDHRGMTVTFETRPGDNVGTAAYRAARYYPIAVRIDGVVAEREDFLEGADHIETWKGLRIGLYDRDRHGHCRHGNVNFHGVTLEAPLPHITQAFHPGCHARLDVIDCAAVKLVLPARKEIVADAFFEELKRHILKLMYRRIGAAHSLPYARWSEARALGVALPPAAMRLRPFSPRHADIGSTGINPPRAVTAESLVLESDEDPIEEQNLAMALSGHDDAPALYEPETTFQGYAWYDALPRLAVSGYRLCHAGAVERLGVGETPLIQDRPDRLFIEGRIGTGSDLVPWQLETDVLILGLDAFCDPDEVDLAVAGTSRITHGDLVDLMTRALFCPSDDPDAGSYDDQLRWFTDAAEDRAIELLESDVEAKRHAVLRIVRRELYWLQARDCEVTIRIAGNSVHVTGLGPEADRSAQ